MLYKYLPPERIDVLRDRKIRFTQPSALNDPFELQVFCDRIFAVEDSIERTHPASPAIKAAVREQYERLSPNERKRISLEVFQEGVEEILQSEEGKLATVGLAGAFGMLLEKRIRPWLRSKISEMMDKIGILSLSEDPTSELMWAHYGASHRGFLIGFDEDSSFFNRRRSSEDEFFHLRKVLYRSPEESIALTRLDGEELLLTKSPAWSYEMEQRMLVPVSEADLCRDDPVGKIYLFAFPVACVRRVVLGAKASDSLRTEIAAILTCGVFEGVELCRASLDRRRKDVEISCE